MQSSPAHVIFLLAKWRKLVALNFIVFTFLTAAYSLITSKTFTSSSTMLTPLDQENQISVMSIMNNFGGFGVGQASTQLNLYLAILNSREMMESVAKEFNLKERYTADDMESTLRILRSRYATHINDDGTVTIRTTTQTPIFSSEEEENEARELCSAMTNYFVQKLDERYRSLRNEQARNNRLFIEKRYHQNIADLKAAENEMKQFQETHGILILPEQTRVALEAAAAIKSQITRREIEIAVLENYVSNSHGELKRKKDELKELVAKLRQMKLGKIDESAGDSGLDLELFSPLNDVPELAVTYLRLYREVTLQEKLLEFLLPQYEQMKINEAKDTPTVQVLDRAVPPIRRSSPKRSIMVILSGLVSLIISILLIFLFEYWQRIRNQGGEDYKKIRTAFSSLKSFK